MQLVYDRFETIESNLHKAYNHFEDIDPEIWKQIIDANDSDFDISGYNLTITFHEDADHARMNAIYYFFTINLLCLAKLEDDLPIVDSIDTSFSADFVRFYHNLGVSLCTYVSICSSKLDDAILLSLFKKFDKEKKNEFFKSFIIKYLGIERFIDILNISLNSGNIKKVEELLAKEPLDEFNKWMKQFVFICSSDDFVSNLICNPIIEDTIDKLSPNEHLHFLHLLDYCMKKHETEYKEWVNNDIIKRRRLTFTAIFDCLFGRFNLHIMFYLYYRLVEGHLLDQMFYAMNAETSDGDLNKQLVEAVRNYPDPQFAIEVNERYKDYKRYNPGCIDLPFVDQDAETKLMASPSPIESDTPHIDVRLGKYFKVSLDSEDVSVLYHCFYQMFDSETTRWDLIYYLATGADDGHAHNGIKWQGSREGLALFLQGVLPPKKTGFWNNVYNVFRIKKNDEWVKTGDLKKIYSREWDTEDNRKECENLESYFNNWIEKRRNLKDKWEFKDWHKKK